MSWPRVPVDGKTLDWPRKIALAINWLIGNKADLSGADFTGDVTTTGNLGVGTDTPSAAIETINDSGSNVVQNRGSTDTVFRCRQTGTTGSGYYTFGDSDAIFAGGMRYNHDDDSLRFYVNGSERMRFVSGGDLGLGVTSPSYQLQLSSNSAAKPTSNVWTVVSDARVKTVTGEYTKGLDAVCRLRPVTYEYNGAGGFEADGRENISIIAQEAAAAFPECIGTFSAKLNEGDQEETELLNWDGHALTFALVNAVKELRARVEQLENTNRQ